LPNHFRLLQRNGEVHICILVASLFIFSSVIRLSNSF